MEEDHNVAFGHRAGCLILHLIIIAAAIHG